MPVSAVSTRTTILALIAAAAMYALLFDVFGKDVNDFLLPWFEHIRSTGPIAAFAQPFGDYSPPYLYLLAATTLAAPLAHPIVLLKLLSIAGTGALAAALWRLLVALDTPQPGRKALIVMALPSVVLNAGLLVQCDAMWSAACIMALAAAVKRRHAVMLVWCGLAIAIKLQPILIAPLFLALLIGRRVPLRLWAIPLPVFALALLPAALAGWPVADLATIYLRQADLYPALSMNAPNVWMIVQHLPLIGDLPLTGLAMAAAVGASAWLVARFAHRPPSGDQLIAAALLVVLVTAGLLPRMHERYFFLADVLALALALARSDRRSWAIMSLVQTGSVLAVTGYLAGITALPTLGAVATIAATVLVSRQFLVSPANDNGLPLNPFRVYPA